MALKEIVAFDLLPLSPKLIDAPAWDNKMPFGMRYVIDDKINTPNQRNPFIRTVWFIEHEQTIPIFVTAYPQQE